MTIYYNCPSFSEKDLKLQSESNIPSTNDLLNELTIDKLNWVIPRTPTFIQAQNFYLISNDGEFLFLQIVNSYLPVTSLVQASCRYFSGPEKINIFESRNFKVSEWSIYKHNNNDPVQNLISNHVGPFNITLVTESPTPKFKISFTCDALSFELQLDALTSPLSLKDGIVEFKSKRISGSFIFKYIPQFIFKGEIQTSSGKKEISGLAQLNMLSQITEPHIVARRWCFFYFAGKDQNHNPVSFSLLNFATTVLFHQRELSQSILCIGGKIAALTLNNKVLLNDPVLQEGSGGYPVPRSISILSDGVGYSSLSEKWELTIQIPLKTEIDKFDALGCLPFFIRKVIQTFVSKPYCFQWLDDVSITLTSSNQNHFFTGKIYSELIYLS